jgi:hypothetical protein
MRDNYANSDQISININAPVDRARASSALRDMVRTGSRIKKRVNITEGEGSILMTKE